MEYGKTDFNISRMLAIDSVERLKAELLRAYTQLEDNTYYKQQISVLEEQLYWFAWNEKTLNYVLKETNGKLRKSNEALKYAQSRHAEADQHAQEMYAELVRTHTQSEENTYYKQHISELKEQLYRFACIVETLHNDLKETYNKFRRSNEELKYAQSRLAEADQHAKERSDALSQEIRDLRQSLEKSESSKHALSIQLQQSRADHKSTNEELERTQARLNDANARAREKDNSHSQDISDLKKLLEKNQSSERALQHQLRQTQDDYKKITEQFANTEIKQNEALHDIRIQLKDTSQEVSDLRKLLDISKTKEATCNHQMQHVQDKLQKTTTELEDTKMRLNEARASEKDNSHSQDIRVLKTLLEQSQNNERAIQHQLRQTQENLKKITEEFAETKIKETSKAKDKEFDTFPQRSKVQVNITKELQDTQRRLDEVNQMAQMKEKSLKREISELRQKINELTLKNETLNGDLQQTRENLRKTTNEFEEERKRLIEGYPRANETDKCNAQETSDMRKLLETSKINERALQQQLRQTQENLKEMADQFAVIKIKQKEALDGIRIQLNDKSQEVSDLRKMLDVSKAKEATFNHQIEHVQDKLQKTTTELEDTKTRLSKFMGQQLTDNNPNITDLSDKNRPTKLGERFSELYDNEWTDAFDVLGSIYKDERTTVITLITILKDADKYCREEAEKQMEHLRNALTLNMETGGSDIPILINKQMKDCRKALATEAGQHLFEVYTKELSQKSPTRDSAKSALRVEAFLREAFIICWLMTIQDPPVVFDRILQHGEKFNPELYRSYTKSGPLVDFPVWPTMFLHEGGPVLYKGVAQGCHK
ncbi:hypothetical protein DPMN_163956 [Dreissena polymorpha]|uniref:Mitochondria-eating protein n=1 Tax=Dreissena polymorpha TaxID=45954 RepID=A0A9D4EWT6_DREPO|nr:hypothetical protein DPMN_163956 [Dreissena polymorpha]